METKLPEQARCVIIGGGVMGCSLAYHLAKIGWEDVVVLERKQLTCGTTWHAAGLLGQMRNSSQMTRLAQYSNRLYAGLEAETGLSTGAKFNGSINIALNAERFEEQRRAAAIARHYDLDVHVITPDEIQKLYPPLNIDGVVGGLHIPTDGQCNPADVTQALARGARMRGAKIIEQVKVTGILTGRGRVTGVETAQGTIKADYVVNCAGMWGREVGRMAGVNIPLQACEHFYLVTESMPEMTPGLPVMRCHDEYAYYKEDAGKLLLGCFEPIAKPWAVDGIPRGSAFETLPEDFDHFEPILELAINRLPALETAGIHTLFNGPESFTPDDRFHLGEAPELKNFYVACGYNSIGIQSAGGAGFMLAEWMDKGHAPVDLSEVDIRRMMPFEGGTDYLAGRVTETLGLLYAMHWPYYQYRTSRNLRRSPLHDRLKDAGACFGQAAGGWERANWFAPKGVEAEYKYSYGRQNWFEYAAAEHRAVRENVGLFDQTSFAKFRVEGPDAQDFLQLVCANDVAVEPGRIVYTQWLNERGGIEADLTVTRLSETAYLVITAGASQVRDLNWLQRHLPQDARVVITDMTSAEAVISVMGPNARKLLASVTRSDLSNAAFPFASWQNILVGMAPVRAHRITYVGELGWELYAPSEFALHVYDTLVEAGAAHDLKHCGLHVLDSLRLEKAYRHWGHDITDEDLPLEAGLMFAVKTGKEAGRFGPFIGRDAVLAAKDKPLTRRLTQFILEDPEPLLHHNEPIWHEGKSIGYLCSGNYGHHLGAAIGLGYVNIPQDEGLDFIRQGRFEIEIAGARIPARASLRPLYDPKSERVRL
jgi:4-methylaminobutanoate oxidase (formaldehyde-forming)